MHSEKKNTLKHLWCICCLVTKKNPNGHRVKKSNSYLFIYLFIYLFFMKKNVFNISRNSDFGISKICPLKSRLNVYNIN